MKRRIAIILLLLIGGAVVNVAVAWGFSYRTEVPFAGVGAAEVHRDVWLPRRPEGFPEIITDFMSPSWRGVGMDSASLHSNNMRREGASLKWWDGHQWHIAERLDDFKTKAYMLHWTTTGWPMRALAGEIWAVSDLEGKLEFYQNQGIWHIKDVPVPGDNIVALDTEHSLPLHPLWPGFIINTLFYALLLWLLFFAPGSARRMLRRRRGQCEKCAYPIGVSPVCTECGAAVARKDAT